MTSLGRLYGGLGVGLGLGWLMSRHCSPRLTERLGDALFWVAVPLSITGFLYPAHLELQLMWVVLIAWGAIALGGLLAFAWLRGRLSLPQTGSLVLAAMAGNTGYIGFPVILALVDPLYFAWALIYDLLGSLTGIFGLGSIVACTYGSGSTSWQQVSRRLLVNPPLWGLLGGFLLRIFSLPGPMVQGLQTIGWISIGLALLLVGASLNRPLKAQCWPWVLGVISIKMLLVPGLLLSLLSQINFAPQAELTLVLQAGMPPAFSSVLLAEIYGLDLELSGTLVVVGCLVLCLTLPLWLWAYHGGIA
jgi:malate permease and related proteins